MVGRAWRAPGAGVPLQARARMHRAPLSKRAVAVRCSASSHRADGGRVYYAEVCVPAELPDAPEVLPMRDISLNLPVEEEKGACARGRRNAWNSFQAEWAGQGLTRKELRERYRQEQQEQRKQKARGEAVHHTGSATGRGARRSWNEFQRLVAGRGLSNQQRGALYRTHRDSPASTLAAAATALASGVGVGSGRSGNVSGRSGGDRGGAAAAASAPSAPVTAAHNILPVPAGWRERGSVPTPAAFRPMEMPRMGYACSNQALRASKPSVYITRGTRAATFAARGLRHTSSLALSNCRDLLRVLEWNEAAGIPFFRICLDMFPWADQYDLEELPDYPEILEALQRAGEYARAMGHRLTCHAPQFVKLASPEPERRQASLALLEKHSQLLDALGFTRPSPENKINIHVGGVYGSKDASLSRLAASLAELSPACRARLTIENDDSRIGYSVRDLLPLAQATGVPLVFDFHHHRFNGGGLTEREALLAAISTWPTGVRPVVHWSESQEGRRRHAHADYITQPLRLSGLADQLDVMVEAKGREQAVLEYRKVATMAYLHDMLGLRGGGTKAC